MLHIAYIYIYIHMQIDCHTLWFSPCHRDERSHNATMQTTPSVLLFLHPLHHVASSFASFNWHWNNLEKHHRRLLSNVVWKTKPLWHSIDYTDLFIRILMAHYLSLILIIIAIHLGSNITYIWQITQVLVTTHLPFQLFLQTFLGWSLSFFRLFHHPVLNQECDTAS